MRQSLGGPFLRRLPDPNIWGLVWDPAAADERPQRTFLGVSKVPPFCFDFVFFIAITQDF